MNQQKISTTLKSCIQNIKDLDESIWWIHKERLIDVLGVDYSSIAKNICTDLVIKLITKGKLTLKADGIAMKLIGFHKISCIYDMNIDNDFCFWCEVCRSKSQKRVRWFTKGKYPTLLRLQKTIMNDIVGHNDSRSLSCENIRKRRQSTYIGWYNGRQYASESFNTHDVIKNQFLG